MTTLTPENRQGLPVHITSPSLSAPHLNDDMPDIDFLEDLALLQELELLSQIEGV